jgi:hypothetical protein
MSKKIEKAITKELVASYETILKGSKKSYKRGRPKNGEMVEGTIPKMVRFKHSHYAILMKEMGSLGFFNFSAFMRYKLGLM